MTTRKCAANRAEHKSMSDFVSRNICIVPWSYGENLEGVTQAAINLVQMLAPNDQNAQVEILIAVQHLYWTADIAVSEIRDAYAPGMLITEVVTIAGAGKLN